MASSAKLIDAVSRAVKDASFQKRTKEVYADILTDAQDYLTDQLEPLIKVDSSIVPVAGQHAYNLPSDFVKFETRNSNKPLGYVCFGTNADIPLKPSSVGLLDTYSPRWRAMDSTPATPNVFALEQSAGTGQLIIWPPPNAAALTTYGAVIMIRYVPRSAALGYDANIPFDATDRLRSLQYLLKLHSIWQVAMEDIEVEKADRFEKMLEGRMEQAKDVIESTLIMPAAVGFSPYGKNIL